MKFRIIPEPAVETELEEAFRWIDIDRLWRDQATKHFNKYIITEDVKVTDRAADFLRLGLAGPGVTEFFASVGAPHVAAMPQLGTLDVPLGELLVAAMRHDFCGPPSVELFVPPDRAVNLWRWLAEAAPAPRAIPAGDTAVRVHRIEAGIPWPGREIVDEYLPAETRQLDRAVSFTKGCYLGQEVVERMRSRHVVARQLVGLRIAGEVPPTPGARLLGADDKPVGTLTSVCRSIALNQIIALGYAKTAFSNAGTTLRVTWNGEPTTAEVAPLPIVNPPANSSLIR